MTISLAKVIARIAGAACAAATILVLTSAASMAAAGSAPLSLTPSARQAPKPNAAPAAAKALHDRKAPRQSAVLDHATSGNADLAFLSAGQYLALSAIDGVIPVVAENELSLLDFSAGAVRVVDPDELSEIDLANDPDVLLAQNTADQNLRPVAQASVTAAPPRTDDPDDDDGVLNRILMTFAGALAMASAMRMIIA